MINARMRIPATPNLNLGTLIHDGPATPEQISLYLPVTGSLAQGTQATCRYKRTTIDSVWTTGHPLYRIRPDLTFGGAASDAFAWPIIDLAPGTSYDVEVTIGSTVKPLTCTTRALPATAGAANKTITAGSSTATQQTAWDGLNPGDVLQYDDGTYALSTNLILNRSGTSGSPIYIRGTSRTGTILSRTTSRVIQIQAGSHVILENMTLQGSGTDGGATPLSFGIMFWNGAPGQTRITIRNVTMIGVDTAVGAEVTVNEVLVYDCDLQGNNTWTQETTPGTRDIDASPALYWNDDCIRLPGAGNCAFNNTINGFGDSLSYTQTGFTPSGPVHFYRNDIRMGGDDGTEVDEAGRNLTFYDNRMRNTMTFTSLDPLYGGPFLACRNISINSGRTINKWNTASSGQFLYNNTIIATTKKYAFDGAPTLESIWYQPNNGSQSYAFRNNVVIYRGSGARIIRIENGVGPIDFDHNSWYPDLLFNWEGTDRANLATAYSALAATTPIFSGYTKRHEQDNITTTNPFTDTITLGSDYHTEVTVDYIPTLSGGSAPKNSGVAIANVTDGYSGAAPDRGAIISGRPVPVYGAIPAYIRSLSIGQWYEIPSSAISNVDPAANPGGTGGFAAKVDVWCSYVVDQRTGKVYSVACGGHGEYFGNEVDVFHVDREAPVWEEKLAPTPAGMTICNSYYGDGKPCSRHSYYGVTLDEANDRVMLFGGAWACGGGGFHAATSSYNIGANTYNASGTHPDVINGIAGQAMSSCADPLTGDVYCMASNFARWNRSTNTWTSRSLTGFPNSWNMGSAMDTLRGRILWLGAGAMHLYDIAGNSWSSITITGANAADVNIGGGAIVYVSALDKYLVRTSLSGGTIYQIQPVAPYAATVFTTSGGSGIAATSVMTGIFNRFLYIRKYGIVFVYPLYTSNVWICRVH